MRSRLASHIHFNRVGVAGFRIVVPTRLRPHFSRTEFRLTLRTREPTAAKDIALRLSAFVAICFHSIARMKKESADSTGATFAEDLEHERDRLVQEVLRVAEDPHGVEELRDELEARIASVTAAQQNLQALEGFCSVGNRR